MEQNTEPRNKPTGLFTNAPLWSINLPQRSQEYTIRTVSSINGVGKTGPLSYTIHKNQNGLKTNISPETKKLEQNIGNSQLNISLRDNIFELIPNKGNKNKWNYIKLKTCAQQRKTSTK